MVFFGAAAGLVWLCARMLTLAPGLRPLAVGIVVVAVPVLTTLSLAAGAYFADCKEEHYLEAVESLGGFITLVTNFFYIFFTVVFFGWLGWQITTQQVKSLAVVALLFVLWAVVSVALAIWAGRVGLKKLTTKEY